ncbi:DUF3842 family protein [Clostridium rectalis]|uniref:DUF3842 family protein n=1 Tax=Clostridium rectalis TaxID=2040295 RepID=UPI000F63CE42|nr:DUF3842 family protein [Clostridium rectalis]
MNIAVIDGRGAGIGQTIIKKLKKSFKDNIYIIALGTNSTATNNMLKSGADEGITGEESICSFFLNKTIDAIIGPIGILCNGGINGEISSSISKCIFDIKCTKYIIPLQKHGIFIPGTRNLQIKQIINEIIYHIEKTNSIR